MNDSRVRIRLIFARQQLPGQWVNSKWICVTSSSSSGDASRFACHANEVPLEYALVVAEANRVHARAVNPDRDVAHAPNMSEALC